MAVVVLALSLGGPLAQGVSGTCVLVCLHLVVGAVLVLLLPRTIRR